MVKKAGFLLLFIFIIVLSIQNSAFAQKKDSAGIFSINDNIEKIKCKIVLRPYYSIGQEIISFIDQTKKSKPVIYKAKIPSYIGIGLTYKFFYLCLSTSLPKSSISIDKYGNTKSTSFNLNFQRRHFGLKLFFYNYKFFYLSNPKNFMNDWTSSRFPKRPDFKTYTFGIYNNFILSEKFSMNAAFDQSERQTRSAGSFMIMTGNYISHIYNDSTLIPFSSKADFQELYEYKKGTYNTIIIAPGYGYSFIKGGFNFTPVLFAGTGPQLQSNRSTTKRYFRIKLPLFISSRYALGYNGEKYFSCVSFSYDINDTSFHSSKIQTRKPTFTIASGVRF